ncbi:MAG: glycosyltransferase family 39 protein [Candidatus Uhrbacteria bacterium]|nr:glycosyltransferase family 39 protein [Candidatus Uhrbacteria bacterium]
MPLIRFFFLQYKCVLGLIFCLIITGFFSTYKLLESPKTWFDEGMFVQIARNAIEHRSYVLRASPTQVVPAGALATIGFPVIAPISISFYLFGEGLLQARAVMVVYILLMVTALYLFAYRVWGFRGAFWSTLLVASHAPVYGNGKNVLGEVPGLFFFFLLLYCISRIEDLPLPLLRKEGKLWIGAGLSAGLFMATKPNFLLLLPVLGIALLLRWKRLTPSWKELLGCFVALAIPIVVNFLLQFGFTTSIFTSFAGYGNLPGLQQLTGLTLAGLIQKNALLFVQQSTPAYLLVTVVVWIVSVCVRYRRKISLPLHELVAIGFVIVTIAYFLKMPGFFRYLFVAQIITFPYFVASCFYLVSSKFRMILVIVFTMMVTFQLYQVSFRSWVAAYYQNLRTSELTAFFGQLDPSKHVFFYHTLEAITFFKSDNYSQYFELLYYNDAFGKDQLMSLQNGVPDVVVMAEASEEKARKFLTRYQKRTTLDHGNYLIFERK